jgi:hypothetical protein
MSCVITVNGCLEQASLDLQLLCLPQWHGDELLACHLEYLLKFAVAQVGLHTHTHTAESMQSGVSIGVVRSTWQQQRAITYLKTRWIDARRQWILQQLLVSEGLGCESLQNLNHWQGHWNSSGFGRSGPCAEVASEAQGLGAFTHYPDRCAWQVVRRFLGEILHWSMACNQSKEPHVSVTLHIDVVGVTESLHTIAVSMAICFSKSVALFPNHTYSSLTPSTMAQ